MPAPVHLSSLGFVAQGQRGPAELAGLAPARALVVVHHTRIAFWKEV
jgi:hypothetical protein